MADENKKVLMGKDIDYEAWLKYMLSPPTNILFEDYMFPSVDIENAFISNMAAHDEKTVLRILYKFLDFSKPLGADHMNLEYLLKALKNDKDATKQMIAKNPYYKRLLQSVMSQGKVPLYDSIQWVLDLLPERPREALNVISAFLSIHIAHLPDGRIHGLSDAESIIRARYFDAEVDKSVLYSLSPTEFEHVVENLYHEMGYKTRMTKASYDGGRDVIASKTEAGKKEHIVISCKRVRDAVQPPDYREIFAPMDDEKATKGVVVATSNFSSEAYKLAARNPRFELINLTELHKLLNEYLGANWTNHLSYSIQSSQDRHPQDSRV